VGRRRWVNHHGIAPVDWSEHADDGTGRRTDFEFANCHLATGEHAPFEFPVLNTANFDLSQQNSEVAEIKLLI